MFRVDGTPGRTRGASEEVLPIVMSGTGTVKSFSSAWKMVSSTHRLILFGDSEVVVGGFEVGLGAVDYRIFRLLRSIPIRLESDGFGDSLIARQMFSQ